MAKYRGPKSKIERKYNEPILGHGKTLEKKNYGPGQHGKKRSRLSEYGTQLRDKQKVKYIYGLLEKQFKIYYNKAVKRIGDSGTILRQLLEQRLDNIAYRAGFGKTRRHARQLVSHKHIQVNGKTVNIASYLIKPGDIISIRPKSQKMISQQANFENKAKKYPWMSWNTQDMKVTFNEIPEIEQIPEHINQQSIIELYSK
ncbi:MAG: 30S ribosomal protein S4 [Bacteroidota bacterium]